MSGEPSLVPALYLIATPIGNLGDLSERAVDSIRDADRLYAEDTRHSRKLLNHLGIERSLLPCHEHNEQAHVGEICHLIESGLSCGLLCDAGTPGISDPGFRLVRECRRRQLPVVPIPGPTALIAALSASGLPTDTFRFVGFLAPKKSARIRFLTENRQARETLVLYESTHRIQKFLTDAEAVLGPERVVCLARELTKRHETILTGPLGEVRAAFSKGSAKGEFVICIAREDYQL